MPDTHVHAVSDDIGAPRLRQVPAVTRAVAIMRLLGRTEQPLGVNQIARELDLIPSTCLHILRVLVEEGLASFDEPTKRYGLGIGILPIARNAMRRNGFTQLVQPHLEELATAFGVTAIGVQLTGLDHMTVVAMARSPLPFRVQVDIGSRFPALISATGRCCAAFNGEAPRALKGRFETLHWDNPPEFDTWLEQVAETRRRGYGIDRGEYISGVTILSVPLLDGGRITHCIVAVGVTEQLRKTGTDGLSTRMLQAAGETAAMLHG